MTTDPVNVGTQDSPDGLLDRNSDVLTPVADLAPYISPAAFDSPLLLCSSAWLEHGPFALWIATILQPRTIVELGSHNGFSYFSFCQAVKKAGLDTRCFAVDTWQGDEHSGLYSDEVFENVTNHNSLYYSAFSTLVRSTFEKALAYFPDSSIDLLHIDGRHFYDDVKYDFESWLPKLSDRAVVLFHDTNVRERNFGVHKYWAELAGNRPHFEFYHGHGLGVLGVGKNLPAAILPLFSASKDQIVSTSIRSAYSRLGSAVQFSFLLSSSEIAETRLALAARGGVISAMQSELDRCAAEIVTLVANASARSVEISRLNKMLQGRASDKPGVTKINPADSSNEVVSLKNRLDETLRQYSVLEKRTLERASELVRALKATAYGDREKFAIGLRLEEATKLASNSEKMRSVLEAKLQEVESQLSARDNDLLKLSNMLHRHSVEHAGREAELSEIASTERRRLEVDLEAIMAEKESSDRRVQAFIDSSSWRITRPLRAFRRLANRLFMRSPMLGNDNSSVLPAEPLAAIPDAQTTDVASSPKGVPELLQSNSAGTEDHPGSTDLHLTLPGLEGLSTSTIRDIENAFEGIYYLKKYPDIAAVGADPFEHYMLYGWKERRDPSRAFSTSYYLQHSPDVEEGGINPFVHWVRFGKNEERPAIPFAERIFSSSYEPKVSVVVPNYNHARYLIQRLDSILSQTYSNIDVLVLDDCSSDDSRDVIERYCREHPDRVRALFNDKNSGGVFRQWRKGTENVEGDLVWICESDDFCEPDFLEKLVPHFCDDSIHIAFGRIQHTDKEGNFVSGLDQYREGAEAGIWGQSLIRPARQWFASAFGVNNVIANVGGCIWRRAEISDEIWSEAAVFSVVGDWYLYCHIANGGQIAWEPGAVSYFRGHGANTSVSSFVRPVFYQELERLMLELRSQWNVPDETVEKFHSKVVEQYAWFDLEKTLGPLDQFCDQRKLLAQRRIRPHILMAFYGFIPGGGELFPLNLANHLHKNGWRVSMLGFEMRSVNAEMRAALDPAIAVYSSAWVDEYGAERFLNEAGVSLVHSHTIGSEYSFFERWKVTNIPYLVTLHGSYEASELADDRTAKLAAGVNHFVYTADKNLGPLKSLSLPRDMFTKLPNAMPIDVLPFPKTRQELGIAADAVVFTLVARGIPNKGWQTSIAAFGTLRERHPGRAMHLLLCGDGKEPDRLSADHGTDRDITFLGYQARIHGLYRLTDVAIVPTRFSGESFPLCIIQSLQVGTPVIATRVGEIETMLAPEDGYAAGILINVDKDDDIFANSLACAMDAMLLDKTRSEYAAAAKNLGSRYDMEELVTIYGKLYQSMMAPNSGALG